MSSSSVFAGSTDDEGADAGAERRRGEALARRVLEREGYTVVEADSGRAAERLLASRPDLRVLYMSGYTADELRSRGLEEDGENFLRKPFTPVQLAEAVRRALSS